MWEDFWWSETARIADRASIALELVKPVPIYFWQKRHMATCGRYQLIKQMPGFTPPQYHKYL